MYSLYHSLLAQHPKQLSPLRCSASTIAQLASYFEEVVLENNLGALVVESLATSPERSAREFSRLRELVQTARNLFLFASAKDAISKLMRNRGRESREAVVFEQRADATHERFVVIADVRFSALLASVHEPNDTSDVAGDMVVWTFEPDVVYSALEYLMARVTAEHPFHASSFSNAVRVSMPKATSLHLTLGVTTKLARRLQEQAEREIAVNRIATAMRNSLQLDSLLETATTEVARALNVRCCAVQIDDDLIGQIMTKYCFRPSGPADEETLREVLVEIAAVRVTLPHSPRAWVIDANAIHDDETRAQAAVPLIYKGKFVGLLFVLSEEPTRVWADSELLLLHTVADQLTAAVHQAHLFAQTQRQALTDELTGCFNRRSFEMQLERDLHLAIRMRQPVSLLMMDLDNFKHINDQGGHDVGDVALRSVADILRKELRIVDSAARFGGDEFAIILPQTGADGGLIVAERLRSLIEKTDITGFGLITASFGLASFPAHASSRDSLVVAADRALYHSKNSGRNHVSLPPAIPSGTSASLETLTRLEDPTEVILFNN